MTSTAAPLAVVSVSDQLVVDLLAAGNIPAAAAAAAAVDEHESGLPVTVLTALGYDTAAGEGMAQTAQVSVTFGAADEAFTVPAADVVLVPDVPREQPVLASA